MGYICLLGREMCHDVLPQLFFRLIARSLSMDRDVSFQVLHGDMSLLQKILVRASSQETPGRNYAPESAPEWAEAWTNLLECCDMAMGRAFHYREYGLEEVLARFSTLLRRATFGTWDQDEHHVAILPCHLTALEHDYWYRYEQHVGGFHTSQFDAAPVLDQLEGTRESMRHRLAVPAAAVLDFWVDAAMLEDLSERIDFSGSQIKAIKETLWLSAARCAAAAAGRHASDMAACLRSVRLLTACKLPQFPMRLLPESPWRLLISVDVPTWNNIWQDAAACPHAHLQLVEDAEVPLTSLLHAVQCSLSKREVLWFEMAVSAVSATIECLRVSTSNMRA